MWERRAVGLTLTALSFETATSTIRPPPPASMPFRSSRPNIGGSDPAVQYLLV